MRPRAPARPPPITAVGTAAPAEELEELPAALLAAAELEGPDVVPRVLDPEPEDDVVKAVLFLPEPVEEAVEFAAMVEVKLPLAATREELADAMRELAAERELSAEVTAAAPVLTGTRYVWISVGKPLNHDGVCPPANSDTIAEEAAAELPPRSRETIDAGTAVWRTE